MLGNAPCPVVYGLHPGVRGGRGTRRELAMRMRRWGRPRATTVHRIRVVRRGWSGNHRQYAHLRPVMKVAKGFKGARRSDVEAILDSLAALGMVVDLDTHRRR